MKNVKKKNDCERTHEAREQNLIFTMYIHTYKCVVKLVKKNFFF